MLVPAKIVVRVLDCDGNFAVLRGRPGGRLLFLETVVIANVLSALAVACKGGGRRFSIPKDCHLMLTTF
jgi:hypothetical protein